MKRKVKAKRKTSEVEVSIELNLDGRGNYSIETGIPFFDHMLSQFAKHGYFDLLIKAKGDIEVDYHHTVEDVGLTLGEAFLEALGDKKGIARFGEAFVPFDETLVFAAVDLSGRPYFVYRVSIPKGKIGSFDVELAEEFFKSLSNALRCNLHIELKYGENLHHIVEAMFKAVGRALDKASRIDPRSEEIPSTKGML
ncbi:MAG: imidazoleglycerol-phosphate dehydratase [Deltaproteobacteria bacterium]|jgi:imidazoleglycerol-phosphate dehydratase|nr:MAG: imidazoleglycerol-phosphate dehydratase [Deltaproteobacteria bacterium]